MKLQKEHISNAVAVVKLVKLTLSIVKSLKDLFF